MVKNLFRSLCLVSAVALIPAATSSLAAVDVDTYRELDQFFSVYERVRSEYVEPVDEKALLRGAIQGMLASLDPHSTYIGGSDFESLRGTPEAEAGLGLSLQMDDGVLKVVTAVQGTPAARAGLKSGDLITHLDGNLIIGGTLAEVLGQMRGRPGTPIKLSIVRPGRDKPFDLSLVREIIRIKPVTWEIRDRVAIIDVNRLDSQTTPEIRSAISSIEKSGRPLGYVLDLRANPGGLFDQAVTVSDIFLDEGEIVSERGREKSDIQRYHAKKGDDIAGLPLVILVDAGTASGAEIIAGALQDHRRGLVMGERSYGMGSVQSLQMLSAASAIKLTTSRYFTPSGRSVQESGIKPDIIVPQLSDPDYKERPRVREIDLRRHLINEIKVEDDVVQDDGRPDPRFTASAADLKKTGIADFQLHYALQTLARLGKLRAPASSTSTGSK